MGSLLALPERAVNPETEYRKMFPTPQCCWSRASARRLAACGLGAQRLAAKDSSGCRHARAETDLRMRAPDNKPPAACAGRGRSGLHELRFRAAWLARPQPPSPGQSRGSVRQRGQRNGGLMRSAHSGGVRSPPASPHTRRSAVAPFSARHYSRKYPTACRAAPSGWRAGGTALIIHGPKRILRGRPVAGSGLASSGGARWNSSL